MEISNKELPDGLEQLQATRLSGSSPRRATSEEPPQLAT